MNLHIWSIMKEQENETMFHQMKPPSLSHLIYLLKEVT